MPRHRRKKLQKKETSAPNPKKYLSMKTPKGELLGKTHCLSVHLMLLGFQYSTVPTDDIEDP